MGRFPPPPPHTPTIVKTTVPDTRRRLGFFNLVYDSVMKCGDEVFSQERGWDLIQGGG